MMKRRGAVALFFCLLAVLLLAGCTAENVSGNGNGKPASTGQGSVPVQKPVEPVKPAVVDTMPVKIYFGTHNARYVVAEVHTLKKGPNLLQQAMEILAAGPKSTDLVAVIPKATKVRSVVVKDRTAFVDFSGDVVKRGVGGSDTEILAVGAIVNTLTEFPEVEKVQILVEGKKVDTLFGHLDVYDPLSRSPAIIKGK